MEPTWTALNLSGSALEAFLEAGTHVTRPDGNDDGAWFVYRRSVGELKAEPANAKGWIALVGCILANVLLSLLAFFALFDWSPLGAGIAMAVVGIACLAGTFRLVVAKGRRMP